MDRESVFSASLAFFLAPIQKYLEDPSVTEVMVNGANEIYIEQAGQLRATGSSFESEHALESAVRNIAQFVAREVDAQHPILDAYPYATTSPIYVRVGDEAVKSHEDAAYFVAWIDRLIAAFAPKEGRGIVVPVAQGKRGNPVLWGRDYFAAMADVAGDTGAKHLLGTHAEAIVEITADATVHADIDTPEALAALRERVGSW